MPGGCLFQTLFPVPVLAFMLSPPVQFIFCFRLRFSSSVPSSVLRLPWSAPHIMRPAPHFLPPALHFGAFTRICASPRVFVFRFFFPYSVSCARISLWGVHTNLCFASRLRFSFQFCTSYFTTGCSHDTFRFCFSLSGSAPSTPCPVFRVPRPVPRISLPVTYTDLCFVSRLGFSLSGFAPSTPCPAPCAPYPTPTPLNVIFLCVLIAPAHYTSGRPNTDARTR